MPATPTNSVIDTQLSHRSVRKYTSAPVTDRELELIVTAAQRASTSSNLQAWSVIVVRDDGRKRRISRAIGGRPYVEEAPVFLVWIADLARNEAVIRAHGSEAHGSETETIGLMENTLMCAVDTGIAAQNALLAAESLGLGGVFVGSVRNAPEAVSAELELPRGTFPIVGMALGHPDPHEGTGIKPRLPLDGVMHKERYDESRWQDAATTFEDDYREYFETQGVLGRSWARTVAGRLAKPAGLHGRHTMRESLASQGFLSE